MDVAFRAAAPGEVPLVETARFCRKLIV